MAFPTTKTEAVDNVTDVMASHLNNLEDKVGIDSSEDTDSLDYKVAQNTATRHTQNTDTALGSGAVAVDHGTGTTDQIVNVCYGTSETAPTASTTTEGSLYITYTA